MENFGVYIWLFMKITLCKEYYLQLYVIVRFLNVIHVKLVPCSKMANYFKKKKITKFTHLPSCTKNQMAIVSCQEMHKITV